MSDVRWEAVESESTTVLEEVMRNTIRDTDLYSAKRNIPSLIDFSFPQDQADIVAIWLSHSWCPTAFTVSKRPTPLSKRPARQSNP